MRSLQCARLHRLRHHTPSPPRASIPNAPCPLPPVLASDQSRSSTPCSRTARAAATCSTSQLLELLRARETALHRLIAPAPATLGNVLEKLTLRRHLSTLSTTPRRDQSAHHRIPFPTARPLRPHKPSLWLASTRRHTTLTLETLLLQLPLLKPHP